MGDTDIFLKHIESNRDWNVCIDSNSLTMGRCVHACNDDQICENECLAGFKNRQLNCPCEVSSIYQSFISSILG